METKIIVQDSDSITANSLRALLSQAGYTVITIKTVRGLNSIIGKFNPDLLIIECDLDYDEARRIVSSLKRSFNIKIIATSCHNDRSYLLERIGFDDCLIKPFEINEVQKVINEQLAA